MIPVNIGYGTANADPNIHMQTVAPLSNEVLLTERGVLNITNTNFNPIIQTSGTDMPVLGDGSQRVEIIRNLIDDTYNVNVRRGITKESETRFSEFANIGVNNDVSFGGTSSPIAHQFDTYTTLPNDPKWNINHALIDNIKLRDTSILGVGTDIISVPSNVYVDPLFKYIVSPTFETLRTSVDLSFDQVLHIATLKEVDIQQRPGFKQTLTSGAGNQHGVPTNNDDFEVYLKYNHIYIKPEPLDRYHGNEVLAKIYIKNDGNMQSTYDHAFGKGEMKSSGLGSKKAAIYFEQEENVNDKPLVGSDAHYLGCIKSLDSIYYDYSENEVALGDSSDSIYGDLVPYNFKGDYIRELKMPINAVFEDLTIKMHQTIESPILDSSEGDVRLNVTSSSTPVQQNQIPSRHFDMDDLRVIREHQPSLRGLDGLSSE